MTSVPAMMLWTDAYMADTSHLTTLENGAYLLILMAMWRAGGTLPNDDVKLARYAHMRLDHWHRIAPTIREFLTVDGEVVHQKRLLKELKIATYRMEKYVSNGRAGGIAKSLKNKQTIPSHANGDANGDATGGLLAKSYHIPEPEPEPLKKEKSSNEDLAATTAPPSRSKKIREQKFKHTLPPDWQPDNSDCAYFAKLGLSRKHFEGAIEAMTLWAQANEIKKADWHATLKGFLRRDADKFGVEAPAIVQSLPAGQTDEQQARELVDARKAAQMARGIEMTPEREAEELAKFIQSFREQREFDAHRKKMQYV